MKHCKLYLYVLVTLVLILWLSMYRIMENYGSETGSIHGEKRSTDSEEQDNNVG